MTERMWTAADDDCLIVWGKQLGNYDFVAEHDLGFSPGSGAVRIAHLRATVPAIVAMREEWAMHEVPL